MKLVLHVFLLSRYLILICSYTNEKTNVIRLLQRSLAHSENDESMFDYKKEEAEVLKDIDKAIYNSKLEKTFKKINTRSQGNKGVKAKLNSKIKYVTDPVLTLVVTNLKNKMLESISESSSLELENWKDEWREQVEANSSSEPREDTVNIVGAKPWGVSCGVPNQHDKPWGKCMRPMECEPEFRIYRGDYFCDRTQFICCALQVKRYNMYQGFDASIADSSLAKESEKRNRAKGSKERNKKTKDKKRRTRDRENSKYKLKRNIENIAREISNILSDADTTMRKKKTKQLEKLIDNLKKQYKGDRQLIKKIYRHEVEKIDVTTETRLNKIMRGNITPNIAIMQLATYPDQASMLNPISNRYKSRIYQISHNS